MILLDTNVISEMCKMRPDPTVLGWFSKVSFADLALTSVTIAELRYGVERLPFGKRRSYLESTVTETLQRDFAEKVLSFDEAAGRAFGALAARFHPTFVDRSRFDLMIAAIAHVHNATVATRNTRDFQHCGIPLQNPFEGAAS